MSGSGGFQVQVTDQPQQAVAGDWSTQNPYFNVKAGPGGLVAGGPNGVQVGLFAWTYPPADPDGSPTIVQNYGSGLVAGFVHRAQQGLITTYLSYAGNTIQPGFQMDLLSGGDVWVLNAGTTTAQIGQKAFAYLATGKVAFAAAGTVFGGASATGSTISPETFQVTGSLSDDVLTVTAVGSGTVYPGSTISGTGIATGTQIVSQISGTTGGVGTYYVNVAGQAPTGSLTINGTYGELTIGTATGTFAVGDEVTGSGIASGTFITANISGSGGSGGTMVVNNNTNVGSTTITASAAVETPWYADSTGIAGALVSITDHMSSQLSG
jgi:hypothetical protein